MAGKDIQLHYAGETKPLFKIAATNAIKTLLTLGFYRFWARTRERRYFWSAIRVDDAGLEYTGNGLEKFLGFLIAIAFLAVYLGVFQAILAFIGMATTSDGIPTIISLAGFAVLPFLFYARYRARRYVLSRTRFRGIRFGAEKAAWKYTWVAIQHTLLTIVTFGILMPRQTFFLEKFVTDRSYYGDAQLSQGGEWRSLMKEARQFYIGLGVFVAGLIFLIVGSVLAAENSNINPLLTVGFLGAYGGGVWFFIGLMIFAVRSWRYLANHKTLGEKITFTSEVEVSDVVTRQIVWGWFVVPFAGGIPGAIIGGLIGALIAALVDAIFYGVFENEPMLLGAVIGAYLGALLGIIVMTMVWIIQPVLSMYVNTLTINNAAALDKIKQREGDDFVEAEGFADALDVGAAI